VRTLVRLLPIVSRKIFRYRQNAWLPIEMDAVGGIGGKLHFARLGTKPGDNVSHRSPSPELLDHEHSVRRIAPDPQFVHSVAEHFIAGIAVAAFTSTNL
jgi:hypothetical protein